MEQVDGDQAVHGQGPFGDLKAEGFILVEKGKTIVFKGKSKLLIYPGMGREASLAKPSRAAKGGK